MSGPAPGRRAAVLGHPVAHSLSPVMHRAAYAALGLDEWTYDAIDVDEAALPAFVAGLDDAWVGLSVTMPLKRAVRDLLDSESDLARQVGAVNTVVLAEDGRHGYNTDVYGIIHALGEVGASTVEQAVVIGAGATAASALAALRDVGCHEPVVAARSAQRARPLLEAAERIGVRVRLVSAEVGDVARELAALRDGKAAIVSTLPAGAVDAIAADLAAAGTGVPLLDVLYHPWPTALATAWRGTGSPVAGGFSMLVHQAEGQVRLMTGRRPPLEVMRAAGLAALEARSRDLP